MSFAARAISGDDGLSCVLFTLNAWVIGHRLHTEEVPCCLGAERARTRMSMFHAQAHVHMRSRRHALASA